MQLAGVVVEPEDQRADGALLLARAVADDHRVDRAHALDLHHPGRARPGGRARAGPWPPRPRRCAAMARPRRRSRVSGVQSMPIEHSASSSARRSANGSSSSDSSSQREQVERDVAGRRLARASMLDPRRGRVDPLLERVEVLAAVGAVDHDLAVEHVAARWEAQLGEVARERLAAARLDHALVAVDEHDRAEAVVLRLVRPLLAVRQRRRASGRAGARSAA